MKDCMWIAQRLEHGQLRGSFVPPAPIRELRDRTRYRKAPVQDRTREANRLHKFLEDAGIKLASVATDVFGMSGRAMLEAMIHGTTDPTVLAELARGKLRAKLPTLRHALAGRFRPQHAFQANYHAIADQAALELGDSRRAWESSRLADVVYSLDSDDEINAQRLELASQGHKVVRAAGEPVARAW